MKLLKPITRPLFRAQRKRELQRATYRAARKGEPVLDFQCNICGQTTAAPEALIRQSETSSCGHCLSSLRFRAVIQALSIGLFGRGLVINDFPEDETRTGIGMSDDDCYAKPLAQKLDYTNTYYHRDPKLDICQIESCQRDRWNFIISTEVLEHVPGPVEKAWSNLYSILKPDGFCVLTVPHYRLDHTEECFPELYDYHLKKQKGRYILVNRTVDGQEQQFNQLHFHGGPGSTLVMRHFALEDLLVQLKNAGFLNIQRLTDEYPEFGILWSDFPFPPLILHKKCAGSL